MSSGKTIHFIAIDVHSSFCEGGWINQEGVERGRFKVPTNIPALTAAIEKVPGRRRLVIEEGPLADWLCRHLRELVEEMVCCDPWRNALIAKGGEKSDPIDWRKLAQLFRGGYITPVHHPEELQRSLFKQQVQLYHDRVRHRVSEALKLIWRVRRLGVFIKEKDLIDPERRSEMLKQLPIDARPDVEVMLDGYDQASEQVAALRRTLCRAARMNPMIKRLCELPGIGVIRAATFLAYIDTPFRFKAKKKLWKYMGIGLEKRQSGTGHVSLRVPRRCSRVLKSVILGAAKSAAAAGDNPFADQYQRWLDDGCSRRIARRNLARSLATVMWGMCKSDSKYDPALVGRMLQAN